jgi:hypothetical protein
MPVLFRSLLPTDPLPLQQTDRSLQVEGRQIARNVFVTLTEGRVTPSAASDLNGFLQSNLWLAARARLWHRN